MRRIIGTLLAIGTAVGSTACNTKREGAPAPVQQRDDAGPLPAPVDAPGFADTRDRIVAALDAKLGELDAKIAALKVDLAARANEATTATTAAATAATSAAVAALERERDAARSSLAEARQATADTWAQLERRTADTVTRVQDAYDAAAKSLRR